MSVKQKPQAARMPAARPTRILLVEDNPVFRRFIEDSIAGLGFHARVTSCDSGAAALDFIADPRTRLELALVDLGLPDVSGIQVIEAARRRFTEMPIMVISVVSAEPTVLAAIRAGARGYILKGDSEQAIATAIEQVLKGNYPISPALARSLFKLAGAPAATGEGDGFGLSPREVETLRHISQGRSYEEVARLMSVAVSTIQSHIRSLYRKLDAHTQMQAVAKARDRGIL